MEGIGVVEMAADRQQIEAQTKLLPAWFTERMMNDNWTFGLKLVSGEVLVIRQIEAIKQAADGSLWLDVEMADYCTWLNQTATGAGRLIFAPISRTTASVNAAHVVAAFDLGES